MSSDLVSIFLLSLLAMFNPTLIAAVTVMMLLPNPRRLMAGYLLGAYTTSITVGMIIVFAVPQTSTLGYVFAPERTRERVTGFRSWMARSGRSAAVLGSAVIGLLLIIRGGITLS